MNVKYKQFVGVEYEQLVDQYTKNKEKMEKSYPKNASLIWVSAMIIFLVRILQKPDGFLPNIIGTFLIFCILFWHFRNFNSHLALHKKSIQIVLNGLKLERKNSCDGLSFFTDYMKEFSVRWAVAQGMFDFFFLVLFCVSFADLFQAISPEFSSSIHMIAIISAAIINLPLVWVYYQVVKVLIPFKKEMAK